MLTFLCRWPVKCVVCSTAKDIILVEPLWCNSFLESCFIGVILRLWRKELIDVYLLISRSKTFFSLLTSPDCRTLTKDVCGHLVLFFFLSSKFSHRLSSWRSGINSPVFRQDIPVSSVFHNKSLLNFVLLNHSKLYFRYMLTVQSQIAVSFQKVALRRLIREVVASVSHQPVTF